MAIYFTLFKSASVIEATCDDYRAGAQEDVEEQERDQKTETKIDVDVLAAYSQEYLDSRYDCKKVWSEWVSGKGTLETLGIEGVGHFVAEEAPEETADAIVGFYEKHTS
jgi:pimeloyl-ACP methyl ester carboxylesterase